MKIDYCSDIHIDFHVPFTHNQLKWENRTRENLELVKYGKQFVMNCWGL